METVDLITSVPRPECERRLKETVGSAWSLVSDSGVVGSIDGASLHIRKKIYYRNSFQLTLHGALSDVAGGTRIRCEFATFPFRPILIAAGIVVAVAVGGVAFGLATHESQFRSTPLIVMLAPLAVLPILAIAGTVAAFVGRSLARAEPQFLIDFLCRTLEAREDSRPASDL